MWNKNNFLGLRLIVMLLAILIIGFYFFYFKTQGDDYYNKGGSYYLVDQDNVGAGGYDVTEYFTSHKAVKGDPRYSYKYDEVIYLFANEQNKSLFTNQPGQYLPQYGGYCAFGLGIEVGEGVGDNKPGKYPSTPTSFKIIDNKLYLFHDSQYFRAKEKWEQDEPRYLLQSQKAWETIHPEQRN